MKKVLVAVLVSILTLTHTFAADVTPATALTAAQNFYSAVVLQGQPLASGLNLIYSSQLDSTSVLARTKGKHLYYIFNTNDGAGFVVVAGDDNVTPVFGYSNEGNYNTDNVSPELNYMMNGYKGQVTLVKQQGIVATPDIKQQWKNLLGGNWLPNNRAAVAPLVTTLWNQVKYFNQFCPFTYDVAAVNPTQHCVTGCVATVMAQIMNYWKFPVHGTGSYSYNGGKISANFGSTYYNWSAMKDNPTAPNPAIATLMFHCGVSVNANYTADNTGAWVINTDGPNSAQHAFVKYFGYDSSSVKGVARNDYNDPDWLTLLKTELNNGRPFEYAGFDDEGAGHSWVCDGYDANNYFHMNWGWGGISNGYFLVNSLAPNGTGAGGGSGVYNNRQEAVVGIKPGSSDPGITLNAAITVSTPTPVEDKPFTVTADVKNNGTKSFSGSFGIILTNATGAFICIDSIATGGTPLAAGAHYNSGLTFSTKGIILSDSTYKLGVYYKPTGGKWILAKPAANPNPVNFTISFQTADMQLVAAIVANPLTPTTNNAVSFTTNIQNFGTNTFFGKIRGSLYSTSGKLIEQVGTFDETTGLAHGSKYASPGLVFSNPLITVPGGSYLFAVETLQKDSTVWHLVGTDIIGSGSYYNPVNVTVNGMKPDVYESNNAQSAPHELSLAWSNNKATVKTTGSNIHNNVDVDYYKVVLAPGYNYVLKGWLDDTYYVTQSNIFTQDVVVSVNTGSSWTNAYDDSIPATFLAGGHTVIFLVKPFVHSTIGTYEMDLLITRSTNLGTTTLPDDVLMKVYPVPASNFIYCDLSSATPGSVPVKIMSVTGQEVISSVVDGGTIQSIDVSALAGGVYFMEAVINRQRNVAKFVISR